MCRFLSSADSVSMFPIANQVIMVCGQVGGILVTQALPGVGFPVPFSLTVGLLVSDAAVLDLCGTAVLKN